MICCDGCDQWFHGTCVGMTKKQSKETDQWFCYACQSCRKWHADTIQRLTILERRIEALIPNCVDPPKETNNAKRGDEMPTLLNCKYLEETLTKVCQDNLRIKLEIDSLKLKCTGTTAEREGLEENKTMLELQLKQLGEQHAKVCQVLPHYVIHACV
ncbi:inactive histone-lysine N-methyltransferase 2E-like isoform X2 [Thrips palmi]|nr:inactive histone-lysine N-methyltransferase 2E-like isoform X2 [Thrips palmi]